MLGRIFIPIKSTVVPKMIVLKLYLKFCDDIDTWYKLFDREIKGEFTTH